MDSLAVVHHRFGVGGAEAVCFAVIDALQDEYDIHLYALEEPDFERLNSAFATSVSQVKTHIPSNLTALFDSSNAVLNSVSDGIFGQQLPLACALLSKRFGHLWANHDLRISTYGEYPFSEPSIQYIHHPLLNLDQDGSEFSLTGRGRKYNKFCTWLSGANPSSVRSSTLLTNSMWTAKQIEPIYHAMPSILYPPIAVDDFSPQSWESREEGIVWIGRLAPDKNPLQAINIFQRVREETGKNLHLHMIGSEGSNKDYVTRVTQKVTSTDQVRMEGSISRNRLVELIESHKWGLHTKPQEHFGMVVAEFLAGGCVPFIPASGGQVEILNNQNDLCYTSTEDAITKMVSLINSHNREDKIIDEISVKETFGIERFQNEWRSRVKSKLK